MAVLEKEDELAFHQTGHNSGVIHSGVYYRPDSEKARLCRTGVQSLIKFCQENNIKYVRSGKVIVANHESELERLENLHRRGVANGLGGLELIGPDRLKEIEPHAHGIKALHIPDTGVVDFKLVAMAFAKRIRTTGGNIFLGSEVLDITRNRSSLTLETTDGRVEVLYLINCAGLYADNVARMMGLHAGLRIIPFRGEYYTLHTESARLVKGLIYPVPDPALPFLGVHFTRNIHGTVEAGPNAVLAFAKEGYRMGDLNVGELIGTLTYPGFWAVAQRFWRTGLAEFDRSLRKKVFLRDLQRLLPEIQESDLAATDSGVRAQAVDRNGMLSDDFRIQPSENSIHVVNAPSPGATSSLSIGQHIVDLAGRTFDLDEYVE